MPSNPTELTLTVKGMDCAGCARTVETGVARLDGVELCELSFATERLRVRGAVERETVVQRVRELGYEVAEPDSAPAAPSPAAAPAPGFLGFMWARAETRLALIGALLVMPGLILHELLGLDAPWAAGLAVLAMAITAWPIARSAWRSLVISRELTINALMTIAAVGAVVIGAYVEAGMVMVLFALGEALEGYTADRARQSIRSLMEVVPQTALRLHPSCCSSGCEERVPVGELRVGDIIVVRPGERIPMDGTVHAGESAVNQAPITGESSLVEKEPGAEIFAGSINGEGSLEVEITRLAADTTISRMIRLVEEAQERRAPVQRIVDRFSRWYTPAVVALAAMVAVLPPLFGQPFWNPSPEEFGWLYRGLALLVVACPCALVISTPASLVSALSAAARTGVLFKGGASLEALSKVRAVAFDKTGTLTAGRPAVVAVRAAACAGFGYEQIGHCDSCDEVLALANAVERRSEHPLAHAIVSASAGRGLDARYPTAEGVTALTGRGVAGVVAGREVLIGSHRHFDAAIPHDQRHCAAAAQDAASGYTPVFVSAGGAYLGTITVADTVRATSREAVSRLKALGLRAVVMLTGDQQATAERIAAEVGVTEVRAELLPAQKVAAVEALERQYGPVAMVGDGINDTPALAAATVGIAIGAAHGGASQAMETADVTLMSDDLRRLPFAFGLSRAAMGTVAVNIALSIGIKLVFLALVLAGTGTMWMAVLADVGTSLLVTLNGMRLLAYREREP
ncbi:MAG: heavy metal translocating P-type ATPase [Chloroflexales bacterium]|nr:heavy metal translocating P-type ATPase [Chloroflexales bacterium]